MPLSSNLTARYDLGWAFDHWEGDATGESPSVSVTMNANKSVTAVFRRARLLVVQDPAQYAWTDSFTATLISELTPLGVVCSTCTAAELGSADLGDPGDLVWIRGGHALAFYDACNSRQGRLKDFVSGGGHLFYNQELSDGTPWNHDVLGLATWIKSFAALNMSPLPGSPFMSGVEIPFAGDYASVGVFTDYPSSATVVCTDGGSNATLLEFPYLLGHVVLSSQAYECYAEPGGSDMGPYQTTILSNILYTELGLPLPAPRSLPKGGSLPSDGSSTGSPAI